jgi:RNA polymerase sigma-70 factor (ECF subfamily)
VLQFFERRSAEIVDAERYYNGLADALAALPATDREPLLLLAWEDLSYAEIATALGVPVGTMRSRINRAGCRLRAHLSALRDAT